MKIGRNKSGVIENDDIRNKIIGQLQNTDYYLREQEKYQKADDTIEDYKYRISKLSPESIEIIKEDIERKMNKAENKFYSESERFCVYMDVDMFFVAVELLQCPSLKDKPVVVGRGVVSAANYVARKYGIRSAMPVFIAQELCKNLLIIPIDMAKYKEFSDRIYSYIEEYDSNYVYVGLDEGFFYINPENYKIHEDDTIDDGINHFVNRFKGRILKDLGLTISVGVAPTKMLAKMCSEINKPDGKLILRKNRTLIRAFLNNQKVSKIPGIGPVSDHILRGLGIETIKDLTDNMYKLHGNYSDKSFDYRLMEVIGVIEADLTPVVNPSFNKSKTFTATRNIDDLKAKLRQLCEEVFDKCINDKIYPKTVDLTTKFYDFTLKSKAHTLKQPIQNSSDLFDAVFKLLDNDIVKPIRLLGVKVCNFCTINEEEKIENFLLKKQKEMVENFKNSRISLNFLTLNEKGEADITNAIVCPICQKEFDFYGNNSMLNRHINNCQDGKIDQSPQIPLLNKKRKS